MRLPGLRLSSGFPSPGCTPSLPMVDQLNQPLKTQNRYLKLFLVIVEENYSLLVQDMCFKPDCSSVIFNHFISAQK